MVQHSLNFYSSLPLWALVSHWRVAQGSGTEYWDMLAASSPERSEHVLLSLRVALPSLSRANFSPAYPFIQFAQMVSVDMAKRRKTTTDMKTAVDNSSLGAGAALAT